MRSSNNERRMNFLRRTAREVRAYRVLMKILAACLACLVTSVAIIYICAALYKRTGSFTINLNKAEMTEYGLSLSETKDMRYRTSYLNANIVENMTNIDGKSIPPNVDSDIGGEHNGDDYIAYTFYLQNAGKHTVNYEYALVMSNITNGLDEAIRVRLYVDGEALDYAKMSNTGGPEPGTEPFYSGTVVTRGDVSDFQVNEITRFTVVMWIEGNDPECLDWVLGGEVKLEMTFNVLEE